MNEYNQMAAELIMRIFLGILFFAQGYDKVFVIKPQGVVRTFEHPMIIKHFPHFILVLSAYFTSLIELIGGLLLVVGLFKYYVLYLLGIDLLMVATAFAIIKPMWEMEHVFPRLILLLGLLVMPHHWEYFSIDHFLF